MPGEESTTQRVKQALKAAGYPDVSVTRGKGTAYGWIHITVYGEKFSREKDYGKVMWIAKKASGREHLEDDIQTDLFRVNILVGFSKKKPKPEKRVPKNTSKGEPVIVSDKTRGQGTGYVVRQVKIRKGTYEYLFEHWSTPANPRGGYSGLREGGRRYVSPKQFGSVRELCGAFPLLADFLPKVFPAGGR
ncbi:MAG: hypothetical protein WC277_11960 [Bacilli bacterium]